MTVTVAAMDEQEVRERTRALLAETHPDDPAIDQFTFRGAQFDHGLALVHFPEGLGGLGASPRLQGAVNDEIRRNAATFYFDAVVNIVGIGMAAPILLRYGTTEMHHRFLRPLFTGEELWCQLFSEPGAGSDIASLVTRALRDGGEWRVSGQKVWTTLAHLARWGLLVARTDPDVPKHGGLSYFVLDMTAPGVEVRPLYQITGEAEFNEVFLTDVRVPDGMRLGNEGEGWSIALTTLMNERVALGSGSSHQGGGPIHTLLELWRRRLDVGGPVASDAVLRDRIARLYVRAETFRLTGLRAGAQQRRGEVGPEGSVVKLAQSELSKEIWNACLDVLGADAMVYEPGYERRRPTGEVLDHPLRAKWTFLRSRANTIEGGTSEVMRNILGERVLGLPGEPRSVTCPRSSA